MVFMKSSVLLLGIVTFLVFHHAITHQNRSPFEINDFKKAGNGLFSSHEGIILFVIVFIAGMTLGGKVFSDG